MPKITKQKAKRNKTIDFTVEEGQAFLDRCLTVEKDVAFTEVENRMIMGDSFQVMGFLPKEFADLLIVDPPYNLSKEFHGEKFSKRSSEAYRDYTEHWIKLVKPLLKPDASIYVCCDWRSSGIVGEVLEQHFHLQNRITWQREKGRGAKANWKNSMEDIWFATNSKTYTFHLDAVMVRKRVIAPYRVEGRPKDWEETGEGNFRNTCPSNFWDDISVPYWSMPENTAHPTQKPEKLIAKLILASSSEGGVVFDPFAGSGTTAVTAQKLGRRFVAIEQSELYCAWAQKRLEMAKENPTIQGYRDGVFWERNTAALQKQQPHPDRAECILPEAPEVGSKSAEAAKSAYRSQRLSQLVAAITAQDGIDDKTRLEALIKDAFSLEKRGSVYFCDQFALRFCKTKGNSISNTILALAKLIEFDQRPFLVCAVTPQKNILLMANTTCLSKISHSSRDLRADHIRGNFNGPDILREVGGYPNTPEHFAEIFSLHKSIPLEENLARLVAATEGIVGTGKRFEPDDAQREQILKAVARAADFLSSGSFAALEQALDQRVEAVREELMLASRVENVNLRGRLIETLIAGEDAALKERIIASLREGTPLPQFQTKDELGDYTAGIDGFCVSVDIKSKALFKTSNPKGYNVDKLLWFLSQERSVYLIYLVGFDEAGVFYTRLCSMLQEGMLNAIKSVTHHWAGRNSRGVVQLNGHALSRLFDEPQKQVDAVRAEKFIEMLL